MKFKTSVLFPLLLITALVGAATQIVVHFRVMPQAAGIAPHVLPTYIQSDLTKGVTSAEVGTLQQILREDRSVYPEGLITGYYGTLTERAVQRLQAKHKIVGKERGQVRAETRELLNAKRETRSAAQFNREVIRRKEEFDRSPTPRNRALLEGALKRRARLMKRLMRVKPDKAEDVALPADFRNALPRDLQQYVEMRRDVEGEFLTIHEDYPDLNFFVDRPTIHEEHNTLELVNADVAPSAHSRVHTTALALQETAIVSRGARTKILATPSLTATKQLSFAVVLLNFPDMPRANESKSAVDRYMNDLKSFYLDNSYGALSMTWQTFGWYTSQDSYTAMNCDFDELRSDALTAAGTSLDASLFTHLLVYMPSGRCPWSGIATVGYSPFQTNPGRLMTSFIQSAHPITMAHEVGHNFGARHAGYLNCPGGVPITTDARQCIRPKPDNFFYHDRFDAMGGGNVSHLNAYHKSIMGFLGPAEIATVSGSGRFTLTALGSSDSGTKALKIPRRAHDAFNKDSTIWVEFRRNIGRDAIAPPYVDGALIRLNHTSVIREYSQGLDTVVVDGSPGSAAASVGTDYDVVWHIGQRFYDPVSGVYLTPLAIIGNTLEVEVSYTNPPPVSPISSPSVRPSPSPSPRSTPTTSSSPRPGTIRCPSKPLTLDMWYRGGTAFHNGNTGGQVSVLQEFLWQYREIYGWNLVNYRKIDFVTGFYGPRTQTAVQHFQRQFRVANAGEYEYGKLLVKTRNAILAQCGRVR